MAYIAPTILDRVAIGDDKYTITKLDDGRYQLTPCPDTVIEPGTEINKALLQALVNAVAEHDTELDVLKSRGIFNIASGSYVGDGTGTFDLRASANNSYKSIGCLGVTPREIELPFAPQVLLLIEKTTRDILVVTSSISIKPYISATVSRTLNGTSSSGAGCNASDSIVTLSDNKLQLVNTARATQTVDTANEGATVSISNVQFKSSSSSSDTVTTYNKSGYTYYYLAF